MKNKGIQSRFLVADLIRRGGWSGILLLVVGALVYHFNPTPVQTTFPGMVSILRSLLGFQANGFLHAGILLLMVTPLLSLTLVGIFALYQKDWRMSIISASLLIILFITIAVHVSV